MPITLAQWAMILCKLLSHFINNSFFIPLIVGSSVREDTDLSEKISSLD